MIKTKYKIRKAIDELEEILIKEQSKIQMKISPSAPQSFSDDMNGCARGISMATTKAVQFLKKELLGA